jgi:hypothetical protein
MGQVQATIPHVRIGDVTRIAGGVAVAIVAAAAVDDRHKLAQDSTRMGGPAAHVRFTTLTGNDPPGVTRQRPPILERPGS